MLQVSDTNCKIWLSEREDGEGYGKVVETSLRQHSQRKTVSEPVDMYMLTSDEFTIKLRSPISSLEPPPTNPKEQIQAIVDILNALGWNAGI